MSTRSFLPPCSEFENILWYRNTGLRIIDDAQWTKIRKNMQSTVNIFGSESGHLSNRIIRRFVFIFCKNIVAVFRKYVLYLLLFQSGECQMCSKTLQFLLLFKWQFLEPKIFTLICWSGGCDLRRSGKKSRGFWCVCAEGSSGGKFKLENKFQLCSPKIIKHSKNLAKNE